MHLLVPFFGCVILATSCMRYQYATIESNTIAKNEQSQFIVENDTLKIQYSFNGRNAPINMVIQNKLDVPLYIDWKQSALIVNGKAITYAPSETSINGTLATVGYKVDRNFEVVSGSLNATATTSETLAFLPPHTFITRQPFSLTNGMIKVPDSITRKIPMYNANGESVRVKQAVFSEGNSPLRFRSYMMVSVGEAGAKPVVLEHSFYLSELLTTGVKPDMFGNQRLNAGNKYYVGQSTGYGRTMTGFGVIAGTAVIAGASQALQESTKK